MRRPAPLPALYAATLTACLVTLLTLTGPALDAYDQKKALQDSQKQAQRQTRFERAAGVMCGRHGWRLLPDQITVQCGARPTNHPERNPK